jgi:hypothetical protein
VFELRRGTGTATAEVEFSTRGLKVAELQGEAISKSPAKTEAAMPVYAMLV